MNDIVERLTAGLQVIERRLVAPKSPHEIEFGLAFREILTETRDEIVRLRARLAEAEALLREGCGYIDDVPDRRSAYKDRVRAFLSAAPRETGND